MKQPKKTIQQKMAEDKAIDHRAAIEAEELVKDKACEEEVNAALAKYNRLLSGTVTFVQGRHPIWKTIIIRPR